MNLCKCKFSKDSDGRATVFTEGSDKTCANFYVLDPFLKAFFVKAILRLRSVRYILKMPCAQ